MRKPWALWGRPPLRRGGPRASLQGLRGTRPAAGGRLLRCEALEDRRLLTAYTVNSLADVVALDGVITLREALEAANTNAPVCDAPAGSATQDDAIQFARDISGGAIVLGGAPLEIAGNVAINGPGAGSLRIDANHQSGVFSVGSGLHVSIVGLSIAGGASTLGAGIYNSPGTTLHVVYVNLVDNVADRGGGIFNNRGDLNVAFSAFSGNSAAEGGGIFNAGESAHSTVTRTGFSGNSAGRGGGIVNELGTLDVDDSTFWENSASDDGGGAIWIGGGATIVAESTFLGNSASGAQGNGGAVGCAEDVASGTLAIVDSTFESNTASASGGAVYNRRPIAATIVASPFLDNSAGLDGGAIANAGALSVSNSLIAGNSAGRGGGLYNDGFGTMSVAGATISHNTADLGGGVFGDMHGTLAIADSTITDNTANEHGGGIYNYHLGTMSLADSTVAHNTAGGSGGGAFNSGTLGLTRATLTDNAAASGGALRNDGFGALSLVGSTLARNNAQTDGGAIHNAWTLAVADCTIENNTAASGGAIANAGTLSIANSTLAGNSAQLGGAIANRAYATLTVTFSTFQGNAAEGYGGAIDSFHGATNVISSILVGNTAAEGGAVSNRAYGVLRITNSTLAGNQADLGGGICNSTASTLLAMNSILAGNEATYFANLCGELTEPSTGNLIDLDPRFVRDPSDGGDGWGDDPATPGVDESANDDYGDLHVASGSAAINAGSNAWALDASGNPLAVDWDNRPRIIHVTVDAGVYEYGVIGDANGDDLVDALDAAVLASHWLKPGAFTWDDGDFNGDGRVDELDLAILAANWSPPGGDAATTGEELDARFVGPRQRSDANAKPRRLSPLRSVPPDEAGSAAPASTRANAADDTADADASTADNVPTVVPADQDRLRDQVLAQARGDLASLDPRLAWSLGELDSRAARRPSPTRRTLLRPAIDPILVGLD
ncbi:MAG: hypothetical protein JW809_16090 [Pirellulales bacterium]|nr:hypothetical protein [Pirellulales bacterium]